MRFFKFILVSFLAMSQIQASHAAHQIKGYWLNERNQIGIDIEETSHGIRVRRLDQNRWHHYDRIRDDQYRDQRGNTYFQPDADELEWESHDGGRRLRFRRSDSAERYTQHDRNQYRNHTPGRHNTYERLSGTWINESTGKRIQIREKQNRLKVRTRGKWQDYRQTRGGDFIDRRGNRYRINHGRLEYISHRGDLVMRFKKY